MTVYFWLLINKFFIYLKMHFSDLIELFFILKFLRNKFFTNHNVTKKCIYLNPVFELAMFQSRKQTTHEIKLLTTLHEKQCICFKIWIYICIKLRKTVLSKNFEKKIYEVENLKKFFFYPNVKKKKFIKEKFLYLF